MNSDNQDISIRKSLILQAMDYKSYDSPLLTQFDDRASKLLKKDYWRVTKSFKFYVNKKEDNIWVVIPEGYLTDGASVPRIFWGLIPPWGRYGQAAVIHDYLVETLTLFDNELLKNITRAKADSIFREAMRIAGVGKFKSQLMYLAVRIYSKMKIKTNLKLERLKESLTKEDYWKTSL